MDPVAVVRLWNGEESPDVLHVFHATLRVFGTSRIHLCEMEGLDIFVAARTYHRKRRRADRLLEDGIYRFNTISLSELRGSTVVSMLGPRCRCLHLCHP